MHYVYILQSQKDSFKYYVGLTDNLARRVGQHNTLPGCSYTIKYGPWNLKTHIAFEDNRLAGKFEIYLKSHSGKAFLKKHLL